MRILLDYRPALHERTGVGEVVHELARALVRTGTDEVRLFSASLTHRPAAAVLSELAGARVIHHRIPVRALTWAWNRLGWPPSEWLAGRSDVVHSPTPLIIPSRHAARVVTIHDLDFLSHPEHVEGEMRRDFPRLARDHAHRADHIIVPSQHVAREVGERLGVAEQKISVCPHGAPLWAADVARARESAASTLGTLGTLGTPGTVGTSRSILFFGTLEPRKNVGTLLDGYARLRERRPDAPPLVLAGGIRASVEHQLAQLRSAPLVNHVTALGYVSEAKRRELYRDAAMLVLVSFDEGFGLPVLEAMACGVPVVISNRGALPEVAGDAATPVDADDADAIAAAMQRLLDPAEAARASARGMTQAARYSWDASARVARQAYQSAIAHRRGRAAAPPTHVSRVF